MELIWADRNTARFTTILESHRETNRNRTGPSTTLRLWLPRCSQPTHFHGTIRTLADLNRTVEVNRKPSAFLSGGMMIHVLKIHVKSITRAGKGKAKTVMVSVRRRHQDPSTT